MLKIPKWKDGNHYAKGLEDINEAKTVILSHQLFMAKLKISILGPSF